MYDIFISVPSNGGNGCKVSTLLTLRAAAMKTLVRSISAIHPKSNNFNLIHSFIRMFCKLVKAVWHDKWIQHRQLTLRSCHSFSWPLRQPIVLQLNFFTPVLVTPRCASSHIVVLTNHVLYHWVAVYNPGNYNMVRFHWFHSHCLLVITSLGIWASFLWFGFLTNRRAEIDSPHGKKEACCKCSSIIAEKKRFWNNLLE